MLKQSLWPNSCNKFDTTRNNITMHIKNIFTDEELEIESVSKENLLTANDGKKYKTKLYNELLERIKVIRTSKRMAYQKITDIFMTTSIDYDKNSEEAYTFIFYDNISKNKIVSYPLIRFLVNVTS